MLVVVDIGNTNIVLGFLDGNAIAGTYRITIKASHTSDEYGLFLIEFPRTSGFQPSDVDDVIICLAVLEVMHSSHSSIVKFLNIDLMVVGPSIKTSINVRIDDPKSLGADILADCASAYYEYGGPVLVADFGTATTFTRMGGKGVVNSDVIVTDIRAGATALWGDTAQLPKVEITRPDTIPGTNTKACTQADLYYTFLGDVEHTIRQFHGELGGEDSEVIATGGLGRVFENDTELIGMHDPDLIFKGMAHIYSHDVK